MLIDFEGCVRDRREGQREREGERERVCVSLTHSLA